MWNINMKTLVLTVVKKLVRLKFTNYRTNSKARTKIWWHISAITCQTIMSTCQILMLTLMLSVIYVTFLN